MKRINEPASWNRLSRSTLKALVVALALIVLRKMRQHEAVSRWMLSNHYSRHIDVPESQSPLGEDYIS
jgi:hypothetical protein